MSALCQKQTSVERSAMFALCNTRTFDRSGVGEGVVSMRLGSPYRSAHSAHWVNLKTPKAPALAREAEEEWGQWERKGRPKTAQAFIISEPRCLRRIAHRQVAGAVAQSVKA
jgi:hypothetical protein